MLWTSTFWVHWPWWKPTLLRRTVPLGCEGCTWSLWICTDAGEWLTGFWGYLPTSISIVVQESVWILSLSRGNRTRKLTSLDMCLDMQWKVVTSRATSYGPLGQRNNPSGALMPGKGIGWGLDKCGYMAPMGIEHFFDAFCLDPQRPWRTTACHALGIPSCHVSEDTPLETIDANKFSLSPRRILVERKTAKVLQTATHLTWILAEYLADTIAWLLRSILGHDSKILCDKDTQQLLTPKFWVLPLYRKLLNSARRIRPSPSSERARGCTGLHKLICKENKEQKGKRKYHAGTPHPNDRGGFTHGSGLAAWLLRFMSGFQPVGRRWWLKDYSAGRPHRRGLPTRNMVGPTQGLPISIPERILGTEIVRVLLAPVGQGRQWKSLTARKCSARSDNGHCQVLQLCQCSMLPVESLGLNWMIRPSWTAMGCYRRVSFVMCFRRSARLRGRVLGGKGLR